MSSIPPDASLAQVARSFGQSLETSLNAVSDQDWAWWPFVSLRPEMDKPLTTRRVAHMSLCFGPLMALLLLPLTFGALSVRQSIGIVLATIAITFVVYRFTFAIAWNRRASRERGD